MISIVAAAARLALAKVVAENAKFIGFLIMKISKQNLEEIIKEEIEAVLDEKRKRKKKKKKKKKGDRCTKIAKRKYDVWPSAYASGAVVKCRQGKIWKGLKEEDRPYISDEERRNDLKLDMKKIIEQEIQKVLDEKKKKKRKLTAKPSSEKSLRDWFGRKGAKGKKGGWVDCNTCRKDKKTGRKKCSACGRSTGEKRAKYPSCRPTPGACGKKGKYGKKSKAGKKG
jgi:hypothetical protein